MAYDISPEYTKTVSFPHLPHLHALIALQTPVKAARKVMRYIIPPPLFGAQTYTPELTSRFEEVADQYRAQHWAFVEDVFQDDFHRTLLAQFPKRRYMEPPKSIFKSYDIGFQWERGRGGGAFLSLHPVYQALHSYFCSEAFSRRITTFSMSTAVLACRTFLVNKTYPGSLVIPHKDSPIPKKFTPYINLVFFLDATGGGDSGELMLSTDNEYKDIIFAPPILRNSCLIYDTEAPFYHGFKPVALGKQRLALTASFARTDYDSRIKE